MMREEKAPYSVGTNLAVINVYDKTFDWIEGTPETTDIQNVTSNNYVDADGTVHVGITTSESSYIYNINVDNATASRGLEVQGGNITAISKLDPVSEE